MMDDLLVSVFYGLKLTSILAVCTAALMAVLSLVEDALGEVWAIAAFLFGLVWIAISLLHFGGRVIA